MQRWLFVALAAVGAACDSGVDASDAVDAVDAVDAEAPPTLGEAPAEWTCGHTRLAPPAFDEGSGPAVAIDVLRIDASFTFDAAVERASAHALMRFRMGPAAGFPVLDLRQAIAAALLDGVPLDVARELVVRSPAVDDPANTVLVLRRALDACSDHTLTLDYDLTTADPQYGIRYPRWGSDVLWQTDLSDARAGYLLERWLPAPVGLHDTFGIALDVAVVDSAVAYALVSNGRVAATGEARWHVTWPSDSDVMSPLVDLVARSELWSLSDGIGGVDLHYEDRMIGLMAGFREGGPEAWLASTDDLVTGFTARFGPRRWGDAPYQLVLQPLQTAAGMEYPNAATIVDLRGDILAHEVAHAWFGRTLVPARHIDAWFDEAMAMWLTTTPAYGFDGYLPVDPWSSEATPVAHADPWTRQTFITAYRLGPRIVETLFERFGKDAFDGVWRDLIRDCSGRHLTHHDLRRAFRALGDADFVDALFERWVIAPGDAEVLGTCAAIGGAP